LLASSAKTLVAVESLTTVRCKGRTGYRLQAVGFRGRGFALLLPLIPA